MVINNKSGELTSGQNISYWLDTVKPQDYATLNRDISTDVLIIGGGMAGLTTAYCLLKEGKKVVLLEDGLVGSGESGRTTAHITYALDDRYYEIEKAFGEDGSRLAAESHNAAIEWIERTIEVEKVECKFERVDGFLFLHPSDKEENLVKEYEATKRAGLNTEWLSEAHGITGYRGPAIKFPRQAQFHAMMYMKMLADSIIRMGGEIYTRSRANKIDRNGAESNGYRVSAGNIVVATNTPVNDLVTMHTKQHPYRTYVVAGKVTKGQLPHCLWWDTGDLNSKWPSDPYHYVRLVPFDETTDLLISGGEDHKTGQADDEGIPEEDRYDRLEEWTRKHFPLVGDIIYKWSGQVMEPVDYLGFIGRNPGDDNIYIVTGDSGNGMTHTTIGGMLVTDLILGRPNPWAEIYAPKRIPIKTPGTFLTEALNMAKQYGDWFAAGDIDRAGQLTNGEGAIMGKGLKKFAVYRDESSQLHAFSAVCPHLHCIVQWNADEKTFDCPCHGSRFTCMGEVINGPAYKGLDRVDPPKKS
jgi:glycine/D-amino acid oxidase-like deaminating enzyme/nitrite reductase/ring-hydroxylating ferredoxin subunit